MKIRWKDKIDPQALLDMLSGQISKNGDAISMQGFGSEMYLAALCSAVQLQLDVPGELRREFIKGGYYDCVKNENVSPDAVITAIKKRVGNYRRKKPKPYRLVTSINISDRNTIKRASINDCTITFHRQLPKMYRSARSESYRSVSSWLTASDPSFYMKMVVSTTSRHELDAAEKALCAIDTIRALWNIDAIPAWRWRMGGRVRPISQIVLGPMHSLHTQTGSLASRACWYDPAFREPEQIHDLSNNEYQSVKFEMEIRSQLRKLDYRQDLLALLPRYVRALDHVNHSTTLLELWSLLEALTGTANRSYDVTIRRALFLFPNRDNEKVFLEGLRHSRNQLVHTGESGTTDDFHIYQLKMYVDHILLFQIQNPFQFSSLSEHYEFMDLPSNSVELSRKLKLVKAAARYRG